MLTNVCLINTPNPKPLTKAAMCVANQALEHKGPPKPLTKATMCVANQALEHKGPLDKLLAPLTHYNTQVWGLGLGFRV